MQPDDNMQKKLIFVADDDLTIRNSISRFLSAKGFEVKPLSDGFEVLLLLEYLQPDLIISDIRMPKLDGITLLEGLKNKEKTRMVPVIFMSAYSNDDIINRAIFLGAKFFLFKPFPLDYLEELIIKILPLQYNVIFSEAR